MTFYYNDGSAVLCRDYNTANGARLATHQWWLLMNLPILRTDVAGVLGLASDYCEAKPTDTLASAAIAIVAKLDQ